MTKTRSPLSIENALMKALGTLEIEHAAEVTGRKPHYLRALTDPDKREQLTVLDMIKLDVAHMRTPTGGAPLFDTVSIIMRAVRAEIYADAIALGVAAVDVIREGGQAHAALCKVSQPNATDRELRGALRELEESQLETAKAIALLAGMIGEREHPPP